MLRSARGEFLKYEAAIFVLAILFYSLNLGGTPLLDPDEPVYGQTAREMAQTGSWLTPRLNGNLWFDKPPMYFWLAAASYKIFGINEFGARFPSVLFAALLLVLVFRWAARIFGARAGAFAALTLGTSLLFSIIARAAVTDMTLCFFMTLSFYWLYRAFESPEEKFRFINLFYFTAGFSVLTKGPVGLVLPLMVAVPFLALRGRTDVLRALYSPAGFALFALSALPWYLAMIALHGKQFYYTFIGYHNLIRFLEPEHVETARTWFYIPVFILGFFPHVAAMARAAGFIGRGAFSAGFYRRFALGAGDAVSPRDGALAYILFINVIIIGFFSISKTKLVTYILPAFPAAAVAFGAIASGAAGGSPSGLMPFLFQAVLAGALSYGFAFVAPEKLGRAAELAPAASSALVAMAALCLMIALAAVIGGAVRKPGAAVAGAAAFMAAFILVVNFMLLPQFAGNYSAAGICRIVGKAAGPKGRVAVYSKTPSALFYSDVPVEHVPDVRRAQKFLLSKEGKGYIIMLASDLEKLVKKGEITVRFTRGESCGKYLYIYN